MNASNTLLGATLAVTTVSEVPFFFFSGSILSRIGTLETCLISLVAYGLRSWVYSYVHDAWYVLPAELLHGLTFSLSWTAVATEATALAPVGFEATTMGIASAAFWGVGFAVGGVGGGYVNEAYGGQWLFRGVAMLGGAAAVVCSVMLAIRRQCG